MVKLCAFVLVLLWAGTGQAALVYLDANFASDTVAEDSSGLNVIETLTANSSGVVWGGRVGDHDLWRVTNGTYDLFAAPVTIGALRTKDANTTYLAERSTGNPLVPAKVYEVSSAGTSSLLATLPAGVTVIHHMSVSPVTGDVLLSAQNRLLKYDSAGVLQWNVAAPAGLNLAVAYNPDGDAYVSGDAGVFYSIDNATGVLSQIAAEVPPEYASLSYVHDMVFSNNENLFVSLVSNDNNIEILRMNVNTGVSDLLAHWDFEVPLTERWLEYVDGQGLYLNSFDAGELEMPSELVTFGLSAPSFGLESSGASVLLLQGDFNGSFSGLNALDTLAPEPSSVWLLLGIGLAWKRKLAHRHSPPRKDSR